MYERINPVILERLPKAIFEHNRGGGSFFKSTIYNEVIVKLLKENKMEFESLFPMDRVFDKNGNRNKKLFTKGWLAGL